MVPLLLFAIAATQQISDEVFQQSTIAILPTEGELAELATGEGVVVVGAGKLPPNPRILFSSDLRRCAFIVSKDGKRFVFVDGKGGEAFDEIQGLQFSPDGKSVGYVGVKGEKSYVVVDGRKTGPYALPELDLGAGGRAIVREIFAGTGKCALVVDGVRVLEGDFGIFPKLSPDGKRYASYTVNRDQSQSFVFSEGVRSPMYRRIEWLEFSAQGGRFGYIGRGDEGDTVVIDEKAQQVAGASLLTFSPDGRRVAYSVRRDGWRLSVDGEEGPAFDQVWDITFSPDSRHIGYAARKDGRWSIVVNGKKGEDYDKADYPVISSDGKRYWFRAVSGGRKIGYFVEAGHPLVETTSSPAMFSPDGSRYLYSRKGEAGAEEILDGTPAKLKGAALRFTPTTNRLLQAVHSDAGVRLCVESTESDTVSELGPVIVHPDGKRIAYGTLSGKTITRKVLELK